MKLSKIKDNLKDSIYGDQGIAPNVAEDYIWQNFGAYIIDPLKKKIKANLIFNNSIMYNIVEDTFNEDIEFPSISYIKDDWVYDISNEVNLEGSITIPANKRQSIKIADIITTDNSEIVKMLLDVNIKTKHGKEWSYKVETILPDVESDGSRKKILKVIPRKIEGEDFKAYNYIDNTNVPQFYDNEESDEESSFGIRLELPSLIGDEYTIKVKIEDLIIVSDIRSIAIEVLGNRLLSDDYITFKFQDSVFNKYETTDTSENYSIQELDFDIFIMEDNDVNTMMTYIVQVSNTMLDEAQIGSEQRAGFNELNANLKGYPSNTFFTIIPNEFKAGVNDIPRNKFNSGFKMIKRIY